METKIEGINIFFEFINKNSETADKPYMIFLHEGLGCTAQWFGFHEELCNAVGLPGISYDGYGYGKSDALREKRPINYQKKEAEFLYKFIEKLQIPQPVILFGHSDGATIALMFAAMFPDKVKAVISEAHHVIIEKHTQKGVLEAVEAYEKGKLKNALKKYHGDKVDSMFYAWADTSAHPDALKFSMVDMLPNIKVPVLAIQGENDQYGTFEQLRLIEQNCSKNKILFLKNCGHYPHRDQKQQVIEAIKRFLSEYQINS